MKRTIGDTPRETWIFVNGRRVYGVVSFDENRRTVTQFRQPYKIHKHGKRLLTKTSHGRVFAIYP